MKKEKILRKILLSSLIGFPIGVTLLILAYVGVYFIEGDTIFQTEIIQMQNIHILISQIIILGFAYYIEFVIYNILFYSNNIDTSTNQINSLKSFLIFILSCVGTVLVMIFISVGNKNIFSKNIQVMNMLLVCISNFIYLLFTVIKCIIESSLVKKINSKIKEQN